MMNTDDCPEVSLDDNEVAVREKLHVARKKKSTIKVIKSAMVVVAKGLLVAKEILLKSEAPKMLQEDVLEISQENLSEVLQGKIVEISHLGKSVEKAIADAGKACAKAEKARRKSAGAFKKKSAIEALQSAGVELAVAVQSEAEAQKIAFESITRLGKITKYLFELGVTNIANNRLVVQEIEARLKGASQEEISALAREELISVVRQLKAQEDVLKKQEILSEATKNHERQMKLQSEKSQQLEERLRAQEKMINTLNDEILKLKVSLDSKHNSPLVKRGITK